MLSAAYEQGVEDERGKINERHLEAMGSMYKYLQREIEDIDAVLKPMRQHIEWFFDPENAEEIKKRFYFTPPQEHE